MAFASPDGEIVSGESPDVWKNVKSLDWTTTPGRNPTNGPMSPPGGLGLGLSHSGTPNSRNASTAILVSCGLEAPPAYHSRGVIASVHPVVPP